MWSDIGKRLLHLIYVLFGVTFLTFCAISAAPGDGAEMYYLSRGFTPSEELLERTREEFGLKEALPVRYGRWLKGVLRGELGTSYSSGEEVTLQLRRRLPGTLKLAAGVIFAMLVFAFPLGILTAVYSNTFVDYVVRLITFFGNAMPDFWFALILMFVLAVKLQWFQVLGANDWKGMVMPAAALAIPLSCGYVRQIRAALLEELSQEYVIGARARGLSEGRIMLCHVLPNSLIPLLTLMGLSVGRLLGGAAVVETVFSWQGIGSMAVEAIKNRDYPVLQGYVVWMAVIYVSVNLAVDVCCGMMDPVKRRERR